MSNKIRWAAALVTLAAVQHVSAAGIGPQWVLAQSFADLGIGPSTTDQKNTGQVDGPTVFVESGPFTNPGVELADGKAYAEYGLLRDYSTSDDTIANPEVQAYGYSEWVYSVRATGPGATVTFNLGMELSDSLSAVFYSNGVGVPGLSTGALAYLDGKGVMAGLAIHDATGVAPATSPVWVSYTANVGDVFTFGSGLYALTNAQIGTAVADAYSTGRFALQVVTEGGGYTSPDGVVFATSFDSAAPEPGTIVLGIFGALALTATGRVRRQ